MFVLSLSTGAASIQKKMFCVVFRLDANVFNGNLAKHLLWRKEHLLNSCGNETELRAVKRSLFFPLSLLRSTAWRSLGISSCGCETYRQCPLGWNPAWLCLKQTRGISRESEQTCLVWARNTNAGLRFILVRSCLRITFMELYSSGCTLEFLSFTFICNSAYGRWYHIKSIRGIWTIFWFWKMSNWSLSEKHSLSQTNWVHTCIFYGFKMSCSDRKQLWYVQMEFWRKAEEIQGSQVR